ncbi:MAG: SPW repeat protein [Sphaerobacter sp.]|nr:SPW repeat protein [Sphaerobacter sp.]
MQPQQTRSSAGLSLIQALNIALGIWLLGSTYWLDMSLFKSARVNNGLVATLVIGFAITQLALPRVRAFAWVGVALGVWLAVSPFVLGFTQLTAGTISNVVVGILVALIAATGLLRR